MSQRFCGLLEQTAAQILTALLTVDGAGSGLDADVLDGMTPAEVAALALGDGTVLNGNGEPAGNSGKDGDTYRDDETGAQYKKSAGAWSAALYTPSGDGTVLNGDGEPADDLGKDGDSYRDDESGAWHKKAAGTWSAALYTPAAGVALSDDQPVNIGPQGRQGTGEEGSRDDHTHYLPHDTTVGFNSDGELAVNVNDVVEHLSERIQYYTEEANYNTDGSAAGQVYNTSRYPKNLQWVKAHLRVPAGINDAIYRAGVYLVDADRNITAVLGQSGTSGIVSGTKTLRFDFLAEDTSALGIPLAGEERIEVLIRRIGAGNTADTGLIHGAENDDSPNWTYADAENDFVLANHVIVQHENPIVGQGTHSHGGDIRGNLQLGYTVTIDHGSLVGDIRNVNVQHINSGSAADDEFIGNDGAGTSVWKVPPGAPLSDDDPVNVSISATERRGHGYG